MIGGYIMSFCKNQKPEQTPGAICGNPLTGLKDKVCIQVNKVFDACLKQISQENTTITLENITPATATQPLTFVSASSSTASQLTGVTVTPLSDGSGCSRVQGTITINLDVNLLDANKAPVTATSTVTYPIDIVLFVPKGAVIDTSLSATISSIIASGKVLTENSAQITACITAIVKVIAPVDLLIPTYGYCFIPSCQDYAADVCNGVFDLPLYPKDRE